jgi:hypothetical protein
MPCDKLCSGILQQAMGARNLVGIGFVIPTRQAGGINSLESIPGLLKIEKYRLCSETVPDTS